MKLFSYLIIAIVAIAIVAGFFVLGTPKEERVRKFDEMRIYHLQDIQYQVINFWQTKKSLPENLNALINETEGVRPPVDPETGESYLYRIINSKELTFELCANFKTDTSSSKTENTRIYGPYGPESFDWNWSHPVGSVCFERKIDPDKYPPFDKKPI